MSATLIRKMVMILSFVAVAAFAGHGTAMAGMDLRSPASFDPAAGHHDRAASPHHDVGDRQDTGGDHHGTGGEAAKHGSMSCCGKSCTSILPFPLGPDARSEATIRLAPLPTVVEREGIEPAGPRRPPRAA